MEIQRYTASPTGWTQEDPAQIANEETRRGLLWTEVRYSGMHDVPAIATRFHFDEELLEYFLSTNASFISTETDALLQLATRTASLDASGLCYHSLIVVVKQGELVTVEFKDGTIGTAVRKQRLPRKRLSAVTPWTVLAAVLDQFADSYRPLIESVEDDVMEMEQQLSSAPLTAEQSAGLFRMRRQLILLQRVIDPVSDLVMRLSHAGDLPDDEMNCVDFRGARDELHRLETRVDGLWQVVTSVVEMSNLLEQQRQGNATRKLAA